MTDQTALQSERLVVVVAVAAVAALAVEVGDAYLGVAVLGGVATALAVRRVDGPDWRAAVGSRAIGAIGALGGAVGVFAAVNAGVSVAASVGVGIGAWIAVVSAVVAIDEERGEHRSALVWTAFAAGGILALWTFLGVGTVIDGSSPFETVAVALLSIPFVLVFGGAPESTLPLVFGLAATACGVWLVVLVTVPRHVLLPAWADDFAVLGLDRLVNRLFSASVLCGVLAVGLHAFGVLLPFAGPLAVIGWIVRALLVLAILVALPVGVVGAVVPQWFGSEGRSLRSAGQSLVAGTVAATAVVAVVAAGGGWTPVGPSVELGVVAIAGIAALPTSVALVWLRENFALLDDGLRQLPPAGLLIAGVAAAQLGAVVAPVLAVAGSLVLWDALALRTTLLAEVSGAETSSVERHHLGPTVGIAAIGAIVALAVYGGAATIARSVRGEPLVVVVVGAVALAAITVALARTDPSS